MLLDADINVIKTQMHNYGNSYYSLIWSLASSVEGEGSSDKLSTGLLALSLLRPPHHEEIAPLAAPRPPARGARPPGPPVRACAQGGSGRPCPRSAGSGRAFGPPKAAGGFWGRHAPQWWTRVKRILGPSTPRVQICKGTELLVNVFPSFIFSSVVIESIPSQLSAGSATRARARPRKNYQC